MPALDAEDVRRFSEATERVYELQEKLGMGPVSGVGTATISVNAGGVGVWVASTACAVMLGITVLGGLWASREFARMDQQMVEAREEIRTTQNYLNAIYAQAPQLKPKEEKNAR